MRLFVGVDLPEDVRTEIAASAEHLRQRIRRRSPGASIRWVEPSNLHLTLWFLGEVADARVAALESALGQPFRTRPFDVTFDRLGIFPSGGHPRVLWAGVGVGRVELGALHAELAPRLEGLGFEAEKRTYTPHLTLARVKDVPRPDVPEVRNAVAGAAPMDAGFGLTGVTLFRSRLSPRGSQYERILRVPLE